MKRSLLLLAPALALLAGCATTGAPGAVDLKARAATLAPFATATLATNACEAATAAGYTQTINARRAALKKVEAGAIGVEQAKRVQAAADEARAALDATCTGPTTNSVMLLLALDRVKNLRNIVEALP